MHEWPERYKRIAIAWLDEQWNVPSRTDHYLMRIAQRVQQQWSKEKVSLKDQIISFKNVIKPRSEPVDPVARSKAIWMGGVEAIQKIQREQHGH